MLSIELIKANLNKIGRHPITLQHALLDLSLGAKGLDNIEALSAYPHIMHLDISDNKIESLAILSGLPTLVEVNARFVVNRVCTVDKLQYCC